MGISCQDFQKLPEKFGTEKRCKTSPRNRMPCFADLVGITLLADSFLRTLPTYFPRVCLPTPFAAVLMFFQPFTTSTCPGSANYNKPAPSGFAAGTV